MFTNDHYPVKLSFSRVSCTFCMQVFLIFVLMPRQDELKVTHTHEINVLWNPRNLPASSHRLFQLVSVLSLGSIRAPQREHFRAAYANFYLAAVIGASLVESPPAEAVKCPISTQGRIKKPQTWHVSSPLFAGLIIVTVPIVIAETTLSENDWQVLVSSMRVERGEWETQFWLFILNFFVEVGEELKPNVISFMERFSSDSPKIVRI